MSRKAAICLLLAAVTITVYWPVASHPFIAYDDPAYVADNPHVRLGLSWAGVAWAFSHLVVSNWHPLTTLSHMLDCTLFGLDPGAHHVVNLCFHAANTVLLFLVLSRLTRETWRSGVVAGFFALHPLHVESVAWVAERKDLLSAFFFMPTLLAYAAYVARVGIGSGAHPGDSVRSLVPASPRPVGLLRSDRGLPAAVFYASSIVLFAFGLLCKPMLVTLPFVLLLLDYWPLRRLNFTDANTVRIAVVEKLPFYALSAVCSVVTLRVQEAGGAMNASTGIPMPDRLANAVHSYCSYVIKLFWPVDLAVMYPHPALTHPYSGMWPEVGMVVLLVAACGACVYWGRRRPWLGVGWFWFLGMLVPVIGIVQVGAQAMADRYTYLPLIGLTIALVWQTADWLSGNPVEAERRVFGLRRSVAIGLAVLPLCACAAATRNQLQYWRSTSTLFEHAVAVTKDNTMARGLLAVGLEAEGRIDEAIVQYRIVAAVDPAFHAHLAQLWYEQGAWPEAAEHYRSAVRAAPNDPRVRLGLAETLQQIGQDKDAAAELEAVLRLDPNSIEMLNNLAWLRATDPDPGLRNGAQAVELAERACRLTQPSQTVLLGTLAAAYAEAGRFEQAVATAEKACLSAAEKGERGLLERNRELLKSYREHRSFRREAGPPRIP